MNKKEANKILKTQVDTLRKKSYKELVKLIPSEITKEVTGLSGTLYQLEVQAFLDDKTNKNLRVSVSIDDGGWSAFSP